MSCTPDLTLISNLTMPTAISHITDQNIINNNFTDFYISMACPNLSDNMLGVTTPWCPVNSNGNKLALANIQLNNQMDAAIQQATDLLYKLQDRAGIPRSLPSQ